jgi:cysteine desulfurase/selenocysteine lyase
MAVIDPARIKKDFPIFDHQIHDKPIVYLDSASSSQKPSAVIDAMSHYYETTHANVHRGVYAIAEEATRLYEASRVALARFIGARSSSEIVFAKNVTEVINLVAYSWGRANLSEGDVVVLTEMEHHANIVPWLALREERGIELRFLPIDEDGLLELSGLDRTLDGAKLLGVAAVSNVLGTINPIAELAAAAHAAGALILVDGAQHAPQMPVDVQALDLDFYGVTGHKMLGPTGIGALYAREEILHEMPPFLCGGEMIRDVRLDGFTTNDVPWKFEAGTPPIAEAVGLNAAVDYLKALDMSEVREHERALTTYALDALREGHPDIVIHGPPDADQRGGVISFLYRDVHPHDLSQVLDQAGVCVRAGHHCAKPLMRRLGVAATARASFSVYNDRSDVDALVEALSAADSLFSL